MNERMTIRLPEELLKRANRKAAAERRTLTSLIEEGLRIILAERPRRKPAARSLPRISSSEGGLMPGIDLTTPPNLQENDDLAYLGRIKRFT
jgi:hypothetical protein